MEKLVTDYLRALETQLNRAADAGDLTLAKAWREEKSRGETLRQALDAEPEDAVAVLLAARERATLSALPEGVPEASKTLRATWTVEREKIRVDLDGKLQTSLKALEAELTKARDFEKADVVLAYRESLATAAPSADTLPVSTPLPATGPAPSSDLVQASKDAPFENSLGMKFVPVPVPGADVLFCMHETRWRDYAVYADEGDSAAESWKNQTYDGFAIEDSPEEHPVVNMTWEDAKAFCAWLSEREGHSYRLPTDREWSLAVGIGREERWRSDTTPETVSKPQDVFPWGKAWPPTGEAGNYSDQSRKSIVANANAQLLKDYDDGFPTTAPVMRFAPNEFGLHDLGGNVWEWCEDWYSNEQADHVMRGGSWTDQEKNLLLSSARRRTHPFNAGHLRGRGFRLVLELSRK
ncbi:MAG: SUMF1/EgtB/PvdO family nonheme iron enzyme [Verrucomicrobiales bacterium]